MKQPIAITMSPQTWGLLVALSVLWGGSFFFVGVALKDFPPFTIVFFRLVIAALILWCVLLFKGETIPKDKKTWRAFVILGALSTSIPFSLIVWAQTTITSGLASILNGTTPFFTVLLAGLLLADEKVSTRKVMGAIVGFGGVILMIGPSALQGLGQDVVAQLAMLSATFCYALSSTYYRRSDSLDLSPLAVATGQLTVAAILVLPIWLMIDPPINFATVSGNSLLAVLALGALSTALAFLIYFRIVNSSGATNVTLVTFLVPITAIFLGTMFLDEKIETQHILGMLAIGLGLAIIDGRPLKWLKRH